MSYAQLVEAHHRTTFGNNVLLVAQQLRNPFMGAVTEIPCTGEAHSVADLFGSVEYLYEEERSRQSPENPVSASRRWVVYPPAIETGQVIDKEDKFKMAMDPTGNIARSHSAAVTRGWADRLLGIRRQSDGTFDVTDGGILGIAREGKTPGSGTALPGSQYMPHGSTGLTMAKLIEAQEALNLAEFGMEEENTLYCAITPRQVTDLLNIAAASATPLNAFSIEQLKTGKPTTLMGITWIRTNRLPVNAAGNRLCPIWDKRNIIAGVWQSIKGDIWNRPDLKNLPYVYVSAHLDAVRAQDKGVIVIECDE